MKQKSMVFFLILFFLFQTSLTEIPDDSVKSTESRETSKSQELEEKRLEKQPVLLKESGIRRTIGKLRIPFEEVPGKQQIYSGKTFARWQETKPKKCSIALGMKNRRAPPFAEWKERQKHTV